MNVFINILTTINKFTKNTKKIDAINLFGIAPVIKVTLKLVFIFNKDATLSKCNLPNPDDTKIFINYPIVNTIFEKQKLTI